MGANMNAQDLILQAKRIRDNSHGLQALAEAREFLRVYAGEKCSFVKQLNEVRLTWRPFTIDEHVRPALDAFINYVENGLLQGVSIEREARNDVVSDFLAQAQDLLASPKVHPAAPTVIIGAALEEYLRNWVEEASLPLGNKKPSIETYSTTLREADLLSKQDVKDITSWGGLRNHAAHGEWEEVADRNRISLMLEGVNLFMRKAGSPGA